MIRVSTTIDRPPDEVWDELRDIGAHAEWMADAEEIRFTSPARSGVGTTFDCVTRVGPVRLTDRMEVTEWQEGRVMGVRHTGVVTGTGRFTLRPGDHGDTCFTWEERLHFPWWMGGALGGVVGDRVMRAIWRRNLRTLKHRLEH